MGKRADCEKRQDTSEEPRGRGDPLHAAHRPETLRRDHRERPSGRRVLQLLNAVDGVDTGAKLDVQTVERDVRGDRRQTGQSERGPLGRVLVRLERQPGDDEGADDAHSA